MGALRSAEATLSVALEYGSITWESATYKRRPAQNQKLAREEPSMYSGLCLYLKGTNRIVPNAV